MNALKSLRAARVERDVKNCDTDFLAAGLCTHCASKIPSCTVFNSSYRRELSMSVKSPPSSRVRSL